MSSSNLDAEVLTFLKQRSSYAHNPSEVQHIQTHISHVFIAPPYVYKTKKPVDFGFLDYSTLEKRHKFCLREVALNKRLAADVYLGVVGIAEREGQYRFVEDLESDAMVEYAVKMRKLADEYFLHNYIKNDRLKEQHLNRVADKLAVFYEGQQQEQDLTKWAEIEKIKVNTDENFNQTEPFIGQTISQNIFKAIQYYTSSYYRRHEPLFQQRIDTGCIVDGHGDLHLEHIHITQEQVRIYDCIEFNERFRYGDLAADLAFLAMDLDLHNCWQKERYFMNQMVEKLEDNTLLDVIDFYKCYRAFVKGKVKSLQSAEEEIPEEDQKQAAELANRYFHLSLQYALVGSEPIVLIFMGRIGTGKSTLAEYLSDKLGINHFSSDRIRKALAGIPLTERSPESKRDSLYSSEMSKKTYDILEAKAEEAAIQGKRAILDATYGSRAMRAQLAKRLTSTSIPYVFIGAQATDETIIQRLQDRKAQADIISDARVEDFDELSKAYEKPVEIQPQNLLQIDTNQELNKSIEELYTKLIDLDL